LRPPDGTLIRTGGYSVRDIAALEAKHMTASKNRFRPPLGGTPSKRGLPHWERQASFLALESRMAAGAVAAKRGGKKKGKPEPAAKPH
jgi:hypothetical protein